MTGEGGVRQWLSTLVSEQRPKFIDRQSSLTDNATQCARLQVVCAMHRYGYDEPGLVLVNKQVMATGNPIDRETSALKGSDDPPAVDRRQT
jgi:hypothetical protein